MTKLNLVVLKRGEPRDLNLIFKSAYDKWAEGNEHAAAELSKSAGVSTSLIYRYLNGTRRVTLDRLESISRFINLKIRIP